MYSIWSEPRIRIILMIMLGMFITITIMLIVVLVMRRLQISEEKRRDVFIKVWSPLMTKAVENSLDTLPSIHKNNYQNFLILWNKYQGVLSGESKQGLNRLARTTGMDKVAADMLDARSEIDRILAVLTVGHLRDKNHQVLLENMVQNSPGFLGQVAALSLVMINPVKAAPILVPLFSDNYEWPQDRVAALLMEMGPEAISRPLLKEIEQAEVENLPILVSYLSFAERQAAAKTIKKLFLENDNVEVLAACLKVSTNLSDRSWIPLLKSYLQHTSWVIRVQAVNALSGLAAQEEVIDIIPLLSDSNWWVRYRSAQAIAELPFIDLENLETIKNTQSDQYAIDVLEQVIVEKQMRESR
ncbi:MAG TPA: HEAT repeat domain-containing protein [Syntrophomonadaceae bacterium]|nr:HEAT repeat domain-containing protein [Syntrophomonadaceae bacterium]